MSGSADKPKPQTKAQAQPRLKRAVREALMPLPEQDVEVVREAGAQASTEGDAKPEAGKS